MSIKMLNKIANEKNKEESNIFDMKKLVNLMMSKKINILIGSGCSTPAIPLWSNVCGETEEDRLNNLKNVAISVSNQLLSDNMDENTKGVNKSYHNFIKSIINILNYSNSRQVPKSAYIFTTNYDLFIEKAIDDLLSDYRFVFNDGASGYFKRILDSSNYNKIVSYHGLNNRYIDEIASINIIKPHGSINWFEDNGHIKITHEINHNPEIILPDGHEQKDTFINNHYYEMLKVFELELEIPQSILLVVGFSFADKHIAQMLKRALKNPELLVYVFCYDNDTKDKILYNLSLSDNVNNLIFIQPKNLGGNYKEKNLSLDIVSELIESVVNG